MKKFLATLLVVGSLFFVSTVQAAIETYVGVGNATMSENENQQQVINRAKGYAIKRAQEQVSIYVVSQATMRNIKLVEAEVIYITGKLMKITNVQVEKTLVRAVLKVTVTVTAQLDTDDIDRRLDEIARKNHPATSINKPKPVVTPALQTYEGYGEYRMGSRDTLETAQQVAKDKAVRNALERAGVLIQSRSRVEDSELIEDVITSQTGAALKIVKVDYDRDDLLVKAHVLIEIDVDDLNRRLAEFDRQHKR